MQTMKGKISALLCAATFTFMGTATAGGTLADAGSQNLQKECSAGALLESGTESCLPVRDVTSQIRNQSKSVKTMNAPPSLLELRTKQGVELRTTPSSESSMPTPGGIGGGTTFNIGALQALKSSQLHTKMYVQPSGLNPSTLGLDWLFTTATNRTQKGVEVVGIYFRDSPSGSLGVFDWSCSNDNPCEGGNTGPAWIWTMDYSNFSCNIKESVTPKGHLQKILQYVNKTAKLDSIDPPLWQNEVYLLNFCDKQWDRVYQHQYRDNQIDCSIYNDCGWWGPILETFPSGSGESFPEINELGFDDSLLIHDGIRSKLSPRETHFDTPAFPWILFNLKPNQSYGVGNYFIHANEK
jgi:hypothetical protein